MSNNRREKIVYVYSKDVPVQFTEGMNWKKLDTSDSAAVSNYVIECVLGGGRHGEYTRGFADVEAVGLSPQADNDFSCSNKELRPVVHKISDLGGVDNLDGILFAQQFHNGPDAKSKDEQFVINAIEYLKNTWPGIENPNRFFVLNGSTDSILCRNTDPQNSVLGKYAHLLRPAGQMYYPVGSLETQLKRNREIIGTRVQAQAAHQTLENLKKVFAAGYNGSTVRVSNVTISGVTVVNGDVEITADGVTIGGQTVDELVAGV